jgi:acetoacetate decarboxylase
MKIDEVRGRAFVVLEGLTFDEPLVKYEFISMRGKVVYDFLKH